MSSERLAVGQELAFEACRLANETNFNDEMRQVLDWFPPAIAYRDKPWGLLAVTYLSQYVRLSDQIRYTPVGDDPENPEIASIIVEVRYRSLRATGEILCDRERYNIYANGRTEAFIAKGELTEAGNVRQGRPFSGAPFIDKSGVVLGIEITKLPPLPNRHAIIGYSLKCQTNFMMLTRKGPKK